jgi:hypothetical protein
MFGFIYEKTYLYLSITSYIYKKLYVAPYMMRNIHDDELNNYI